MSTLTEPEKVLQGAGKLVQLAEAIFSTDINAAVKPTDPMAVPGGLAADISSQLGRLGTDFSAILDLIKAKLHGNLVDDKQYDLEKIVGIAATLPINSMPLQKLTDVLVNKLWTDLQHPPVSYLGDEWKYRTMDGSNNSRMYPNIGKAGSPYARTVRPERELTPNLPDPGVLFDTLLARSGTPKEHPAKISSMLFYMASIIIHDVFRTNNIDWNKVDNSSYLDLSPLYGNKDEDDPKKDVRLYKDGLLKPDAFAETRLLGFPPGVSCLLIMFNRFHNYVAKELAEINEGGRFNLMSTQLYSMSKSLQEKFGKDPEIGVVKKRENDLFQTARLITCGLYINIILLDYVRTILNLQKTDSEWVLDPRANPEYLFGPSHIPEGLGNQVSVEFNLVYRWHSTISPRDQRWSEDFFNRLTDGQDPSTLTVNDLKKYFVGFLRSVPSDPGAREFEPGVKRQANGAFKDEDLVKILTESTEDVAAAFGAHQVPVVMRVIEMLGIEQARNWNVATLNEFRRYFGLQPHAKFSDITSNPEVAESLKTLYGDPNNVELYPGIVVEDAKKEMVPGSGLCPGYTISRTILSDAVALVRGDRFYTIDYNAASLTNWGYNFVQPDKTINGGGVVYKLFQRALPGYYRGSSVYAMYPFTQPTEMRRVLKSLGKEENYDYTRPKLVPEPPQVKSWQACVSILKNQKDFKVPWGPHTSYLTGKDYMLSGDAPANTKERKAVDSALYSPKEGTAQIRQLYKDVTEELLKMRSRKLGKSYQIDMVADIANLSHAVAVAQLFHVPLKLPENTFGNILTAEQFYTILALLFAYVFLDFDTASSYQLRSAAKQGCDALGKVVEHTCKLVHGSLWEDLKNWIGRGDHNTDMAKDYGTLLIKRFYSQVGGDAKDIAWAMIPTMAAAVPTQAQGLSQILDLLFSDSGEYKEDWARIQELAQADDAESFEKLRKYGLECYRLATPAFGLLRVAATDATITDGDQTIKLAKGDTVFLNFVKACVDPERFPEPYKMKLDRPEDSYIHHGYGPHSCLGRIITVEAIATQLKIFGRLKNLRRMPGPQGQLKHLTVQDAFKVYMTPQETSLFPFPTTMKFIYDV